jgi:hypothetical protein
LKQQGTVKKPKRGERQKPLAEATVNRHLALLGGVFNKATAWRKTKASNPVKAVKMFKENNERVRFLTEEEEANLKAKFPEEHWPLVEVALHTGMRSEIIGDPSRLAWQTQKPVGFPE